ncbi:hypothetical protein HY450_02565 [Candidatus Pacearchaeota archaeon]|nr:hypothetical protein [Candidatus Pacearchaeota archaeon]
MKPAQPIPSLEEIGLEAPSEILCTLSHEETTPYLERLSTTLDYLAEILKREKNSFVVAYVAIVRNGIDSLRLKHQLHGEDKVDFPLTIISRNSGFPSEKDFYLLEKNKDEAEETLSVLPSKDEIIDRIRHGILNHSSIVTAQTLLHRFNFYSAIAERAPLEAYQVNRPMHRGEKDGENLYVLEWNCIERKTKLPVFYRMCMAQESWRRRLEVGSNPKLETLLYQTQMGFMNVDTFARAVDTQIDEVHPKLIEKYTIGPFHNHITKNNQALNSLLEDAEDPAVLKFTRECVVSERVKDHYVKFFDRLRRKKSVREVFGPVDSETKMIVPFRVKQKLGNQDEYGNPCKVYGITNGGDIVG